MRIGPTPTDPPQSAARAGDGDVFDVAAGAHDPLGDLALEAGARLPDAGHARRRWVAWTMLALAIVGGSVGTSALAASAGFTRPAAVVVMVLGYLCCFVFMARVLPVIPLSIAYAVWSGVGMALVSGIGWLWLGQALNAGELAGIGLILVGTVVIQFFSRTQEVVQ